MDMSRTLLENEIGAVKFATEVIGHWARDRRISIPALDPALAEIVHAFTPVYQRRGRSDESLIGYEITGVETEKIRNLYSSAKRAHEFILDIAQTNILLGHPVPEPIRLLVAKSLRAGVRPPPDGGTRSVGERNILFVILAERMKESFGIARFSESNFSATQAIWAACLEFEVAVTDSQVGKVIRENKDLRSYCSSHPNLLGSRSAVVDALIGRPHVPAFLPQPEAFKNALTRLGHTLEDN
ncbi:hypothetical protein SUH3_07885 [Pseudosulfitobacter pseudonitzschiae]|uniref:Uncharacterized protein n=2 Tax=Pseudosulfitobacter pseudonitzschiae TaxID=1402135 RepID=A0A073J8V7_9RHOB|nr:hypothetical protein SUH3_07885 [Pseudosulfitobacter pseudonitzschiae]